MAILPRYVQILQALQDIPDPKFLHWSPQAPDSYYNWLIPCEDKENKENIQKRLRPFLPPELNFDRAQGTKHIENEQGTQWALFAGSGGKEIQEYMWPFILEQLKAGGAYEDTEDFERDLIQEWTTPNQYIFHLVILCSSQMTDMVALICVDDAKSLDKRFPLEQHQGLNAVGLPCVHIAANMGRLAIVKHLLSPGILNQRFGAKAQTILHLAVEGNKMDVIRFLVQQMYGVDQTAKDITGRTPFHCAMESISSNAELLYGAMSPEEKSTMKACDLLHETISSMTHADIERVFEITTLILGDYNFNWSTQSPSPYLAALDHFTEMCTWLAHFFHEETIPRYVFADREKLRDTAIRMLHKLNESLVPLRSFNDHGSTAILSLFEYAPLEVLQAVLESLPKRRQQHGEFLICVSVDLDGDSGPKLAARRGPDFLKIAVAWRNNDRKPEILRHFINEKDYRQAAELLLDQERFKEALGYLGKLEQNDWTQCMQARAHLGLEEYHQARRSLKGLDEKPSILRLRSRIASGLKRQSQVIDLNRAAYAKEEEWGRAHEKAILQRELCEEILKQSIFPPEIRNNIAEYMIEQPQRWIWQDMS
jgi:hypothetical protein